MKERNNLETYSAELMIDMSSVKEKSAKLTSHLKAEDYFFIKEFPLCKIAINDIKENANEKFTANAKINLRGITSDVPVTFEVKRINPVIVKGQVHVDRLLHKIGVANERTTKKVEVNFETELPYDL